jgi:hypothetical protein
METIHTSPQSAGDRQVVIHEVYRYWRDRMIRSGAGAGMSEACSANWTPEDDEGHDRYSDYEEHRFLMEAEIPDMRAFYAMLLARGITPGRKDVPTGTEAEAVA